MRVPVVAFLVALSASSAFADNLVKLQSKYDVKETIDRLAAALEDKGVKVVARVDHAAGAKAAGQDLPAEEVLMFGNPKLGTPLMQSNPEIGIDLPMKVLAWQDKAGNVWVGFTAPDVIKARYAISDRDDAFTAMRTALDGLTKRASGQ